MSDYLGNLGNPGESVAEVDPYDLKTFWQTRKLQTEFPGRHISFSPKAGVY
jgi:hypothetical protein